MQPNCDRPSLSCRTVCRYSPAMASLADPALHLPATARPRAIANWLLVVAALVFVMVVVGGITRLTESGLSITEWKPITGAVPPLGQAQWQAEFDKYRQIPEYTQVNRGMSMAEFQRIYFWEWAHRLLGRLIGLAFAAPLIWFALRRAIPPGYGGRLLAILALGALQGAIGWWMVTSGLSDRTNVSHIRLSVHLLLALFIMAALIWTALDLLGSMRKPPARPSRLSPVGLLIAGILFVQLLLGAWVAGLRAGHASDSWPLMAGRLVPDELGWTSLAAYANDPFLVHFLHRWWAFVALAALIFLARRVRRAGNRPAAVAIQALVGTQILLGIAVVLSGVTLWIAVLHQAIGAMLVASAARGLHNVEGRR